jgi:DNA transposition AAA+ family ATPase
VSNTKSPNSNPLARENLSLDGFLANLEPRRMVDLSDIVDEGLPPDFKPTRAFRAVVDRYSYAKGIKAPLALVTGAHGAGKTTALRYIAHHDDALLWECRPGYQAKHVLRDIAEKLGINAGTGWQMQTSIVVDQLIAAPRMFVFDEAQRLDYAGMDLLKYLADQSQSTFFLSASPSLEKRIERWPDIASRCSVRVRVSTMKLDELVELYQNDGFSLDSLTEIHRLTSGVMRTLKALLSEIDEHIEAFNQRSGQQRTRSDLQPGHIRMIAEKVVG